MRANAMQAMLLIAGAALVVLGLAARGRAADVPTAALCRIYVTAPDSGHFIGSGTLVDARRGSGLVLTCWHTFQGRDESAPIYLMFCGNATKRWECNIIGADEHADLAALEIANPPAPCAWLAQTPRAVKAAGFGGEGDLRIVEGEICQQLGDSAGRQSQLAMTGLVRQGDSGGGVFDEEGRLVGVINSINPAEQITIFCRAEQVSEFLAPYQLDRPVDQRIKTQCEIYGGCPQYSGGCQMIGGQLVCPQQPSTGIFSGRRQANPMSPPYDPRPAAGSPYAAGGGSAAKSCDCGPKLDELGKRIAAIDGKLADVDFSSFAKRDELSLYLKRSEAPAAPDLSDLVKRSELPPPPDLSNVATRDELANVATRDEVVQIAQQADAKDQTILEKIHGVAGVAQQAAAAAAEGKVGFFQGIGVGKLVAAAIGVTGPLGIGLAVAGGLVGRALKKRVAASAGGRSGDNGFPDY